MYFGIIKMENLEPEDKLKLSETPYIKNILKDEKLLFSCNSNIKNTFGIRINRDLVISSKAMYTFKGTELRHRIEIESIKGLTISQSSDQLVIHVDNKDENDFLFIAKDKPKIIPFLEALYRINLDTGLPLSITKEKELDKYITSKKEKQQNPSFNKMKVNNSAANTEHNNVNTTNDTNNKLSKQGSMELMENFQNKKNVLLNSLEYEDSDKEINYLIKYDKNIYINSSVAKQIANNSAGYDEYVVMNYHNKRQVLISKKDLVNEMKNQNNKFVIVVYQKDKKYIIHKAELNYILTNEWDVNTQTIKLNVFIDNNDKEEEINPCLIDEFELIPNELILPNQPGEIKLLNNVISSYLEKPNIELLLVSTVSKDLAFISRNAINTLKQSNEWLLNKTHSLLTLSLSEEKYTIEKISKEKLNMTLLSYVNVIIKNKSDICYVRKDLISENTKHNDPNMKLVDIDNNEIVVPKKDIIELKQYNNDEFNTIPQKTINKSTPQINLQDKIIIHNRYAYDPSPENILGQGSFATVYKGVDIQAYEEVAIKQMKKSDFLEDEYLMRALVKELEIIKLCECKYSTKLIDNFEEGEYLYIILELCDGNLEEQLAKNCGPFNVNEIRQILIQLNHVFYIMNIKKIIHRDLKLANILVKYTNTERTTFDVKLSDFGFSTITLDNIAQTSLGTPLTEAPEVHLQLDYTNKADIWSLGIITYQMYFNKFPFIAKNKKTLVKHMFKSELLCKPDDPLLADLISKMLKPRQEERISWEEYFQHPFFGDQVMLLEPKDNSDEDKDLWMSVHKVIEQDDGDNEIYSEQHAIQLETKVHLLETTTYVCCKGKENESEVYYIVKKFPTQFITNNKNIFQQEKEMFKVINNSKIPSIVFKGEHRERGSISLKFEYEQGIVLNDYIKCKQLSQIQIHHIIKSLINDIFIPLNKLNICLNFITLDSIFFNLQDNSVSLFDCGLMKCIYDQKQIDEYYMNNSDGETNNANEKTNVLNFGILVYKLYYKTQPIISTSNPNEIDFPSDVEIHNHLKQFIEMCLHKDPNERATWEKLSNSLYLTSPIEVPLEQTSLFTSNTLEYISSSYFKKLEVIRECITNNEIYQLIPSDFIPQTCLFINFIKLDISNAIKFFNEFLQKKSDMTAILNVFQINKHFPKNMNPENKCLDFSLIPLNKRTCKQEIISYLKMFPNTLDLIQKELTTIFKKECEKGGNIYSNKDKHSLLVESLNQLNDQSLWVYMNCLVNLIRNKKEEEASKNFCLFIKYLLEYVIVLYELIFKEQKVIKKDFYEINNMFVEDCSKEDANRGTDNKSFFCFLKNDIKKAFGEVNADNILCNKELLVMYHEMFIEYYLEYVEN